MFSYLLVACAFAPLTSAFVFPDTVPLEKRQQPGTPQYECHEDCGAVITSGRTENYCDSANFTSSLDACLNCANEFDIWRYYGESVSAAAEGCGLDATPVAANATSTDATSSASTESSSAGTAAGTDAETSAPATSTSATASGTAAESTPSQGASSSTSPSPAAATSANSSPQLQHSGIFMVGVAAIVGLWM